MKALVWTSIILGCLLFWWLAINFIIDAAIREQDHKYSIRHARCERMDDIERNTMKEYCR